MRCEPSASAIIYATPNTVFRSMRRVAASRSNRSISEPTAVARMRSEASRPSLRNSCLRCCSVLPETFPLGEGGSSGYYKMLTKSTRLAYIRRYCVQCIQACRWLRIGLAAP